MTGCTLAQWSTNGVTLATGLTGCIVLVIRTWFSRGHDERIGKAPADG